MPGIEPQPEAEALVRGPDELLHLAEVHGLPFVGVQVASRSSTATSSLVLCTIASADASFAWPRSSPAA